MCGLYTSTKKHEKSIAAGEKAVELQPNGSQVHMLLGNALCYAEQYDKGINHCKTGIRLNPFPHVYHFATLGRCYYANGQYEDALIELKKAVKLAPDSSLVNFWLAIVYSLLDREEEAHSSAEKVLEISPYFSVSFISKIWKFKTRDGLPIVVEAMRKAGFPE